VVVAMIGVGYSDAHWGSCVFRSCPHTVSRQRGSEADNPGIADPTNEWDRDFVRFASTNEDVAEKIKPKGGCGARPATPEGASRRDGFMVALSTTRALSLGRFSAGPLPLTTPVVQDR
jgi:hypothetical protein